MKIESKQQSQESQYKFPYHHVVKINDDSFSHVRDLGWGVEYAAHTVAILTNLQDIKFDSLLDVGCGDGKFLLEAKKIFKNKTLEGIDYSENAVRFAKVFSPELTFKTGDITDEQTLSGKKFDVITLIEVLEHIPPEKRDAFVAGLSKHLKDSGTLILTVPSINIPIHDRHYEHFSIQSLSKVLEPYFTINKSEFLHKISLRNRLIRTIMSNRLFVLKQYKIRTALYRYYKKYLLDATEKTGKNILVIASKNTGTNTS